MLSHAVIAILVILATWTILAALCLGLGAWYLYIPAPKTQVSSLKTNTDFFATFWLGLATLFAFLQFWHFFAPIDFVCHITLMTLGLLAFLTITPALLRAIAASPRRPLAASLLAFILIAIWLANRGTGPNADYDAGLYHIAAVKWSRLYAIVPGLANLHLRFGFSSTLTLMAAFLDHTLWMGNAAHFLNTFLLAALAASIIRSAAIILTTSVASLHHWLLLFSALLIQLRATYSKTPQTKISPFTIHHGLPHEWWALRTDSIIAV